MPVIRAEKTSGYTVMNNFHLRDKRLSLRAKGLLSLMLSLPENWNYSAAGLAAICREGCTAVKSALSELEAAGYAGPVSLLLPGERYAGRPSWPEERALEVLRGGAE